MISWLSLKLILAGLWPIIWHYATASTIASGLLFLAFGAPLLKYIPVIGPILVPILAILRPLRGYLLMASVAILGAIWYSSILVKDEHARCVAKTEVIQKEVDRLVRETQPDLSQPEHNVDDPWNRRDY